MDAKSALHDLGVRENSLTPAEREHLDKEGYLVLEEMFTADLAATLGRRYDELVAAEGEDAGKEVHQEDGTTRLSDLINKDPAFRVAITHPRLLAAVWHVLGEREFKLSSLNAREALPGLGHQGLHADWFGAPPPGDYAVCNSLWAIDDLSPSNGATRLVPGSHASGKASHDLDDPAARHPDEIVLDVPSGTVVVVNSHTWHGGTKNVSGGRRRIMHGYFTRREFDQQLNQRAYIRPQTLEQLTPAQRWLLDV